MKTGLFIALGVVAVGFIWAWTRLARKAGETLADEEKRYVWYHAVAGFIFSFFDTLGIGNFAPTTSAFKLRDTVPDEKIPGTLNTGYALPTIVQAFIYISIVEVGIWTLGLMIFASVLGAWLGAGIVSRLPRRNIQMGMGVALLAAAALMVLSQLKIGPPQGKGQSLESPLLLVGLVGNFILGALMTLGIGLYAPCLILVSLLGMDPKAAFPIMMGSCAFLMPVGGIRFVRARSYSLSTSLALTIASMPAVLVAAYIVKEMSLDAVRWLVVVVVVCTATLMLRSVFTGLKSLPRVAALDSPLS